MHPTVTKYHINLAEYFTSKPLYLDEKNNKSSNVRKLIEQPWQQTNAAMLNTYADVWNDVIETLCDLYFIEAKGSSGMIFTLIEDFHNVLDHLPENQSKLKEETLQKERINQRTREIIEYSRNLSQHGDWLRKGKLWNEFETKLPDLHTSLKLWNQDEIDAECLRIIKNPTRFNTLIIFEGFVRTQSYAISNYGKHPVFTPQHAFNFEPAGPIHENAAKILHGERRPYFLRRWPPKACSNPMPALLQTLIGHTSSVRCVAVTSDGCRAVSGDDNTIRVWDLKSGRCLNILKGHGFYIRCISITPDGRLIISGSSDRTVKVWDMESGNCLYTLAGHIGAVNSTFITPDGRYAISGSDDNSVKVWDLANGQCLRDNICQNVGSIESISATLDFHRMMVGTGSQILLWDLEKDECIYLLGTSESAQNRVSITLDGKLAMSCNIFDNSIQVWNLENGKCMRTLQGHANSVTSICMTADGKLGISGSRDKTIRIWDLENGQCLRILEGHSDQIWSVAVTSDGCRVISGSSDNTVRVWDLEKGQCLQKLDGNNISVSSISLALNEQLAVSQSSEPIVEIKENTLHLWDIESGLCLHSFDGDAPMIVVPFKGKMQFVVNVIPDNILQVRNLKNGQLEKTLKGHSKWIRVLAVTPDGCRIISGSSDNTIRVWDSKTGRSLAILSGHSLDVTSLAVSPDGRFLVSGSDDHSLKVWDLKSRKCLHTFKQCGKIRCVVITPDGHRVISGGVDLVRLSVWDIKNGEFLKVLEGHKEPIDNAVIMPDGRRIISGNSKDKTIRIWDIESGFCLQTIEGHSDWITVVAITPDGLRAVSGSKDGTVRLWDLERGECMCLFSTNSVINSIALTKNSKIICVGTQGGTILFLEVQGVEPSSVIKPIDDKNYEQFLSKRYEYNYQEKGEKQEETLAHLEALVVLLEKMDKPYETHQKRYRIAVLNGKPIYRFEGHDSYITGVTITPNGLFAISGSLDKTVRVWNLQTGKLMFAINAHNREVTCVVVTPDGKYIISGSKDGYIEIWNLKNGKSLGTFNNHNGKIISLTVTQDGKRLVSGFDNGTICLRDLKSCKYPLLLEGFSGSNSLKCLTLTPDGSYAVVGGHYDKIIYIWSLESGKFIRTLEGHESGILCIAITPDGKHIISCSSDRTIRLWDLARGSELRIFADRTILKGENVTSIAITSNGQHVVSGGEYGSICIWDLASGQLLQKFKDSPVFINGDIEVVSIAVTNDGRYIVTASKRDCIRVWALEKNSFILDPTNKVNRPISTDIYKP